MNKNKDIEKLEKTLLMKKEINIKNIKKAVEKT